jgi:hypothetical protein
MRIRAVLKGEEAFYRASIRVEREIEDQIEGGVRKAANLIVEHIKDNWSPSKPSEPFARPAVDTGNLESSIKVEHSARDLMGKYATAETAKVSIIQVNTADGYNPRKRGNYAVALEEGTDVMLSRPFLQPSVDWARNFYTDLLRWG